MPLPDKITAGDTLNFTENLRPYPPEEGYSLKYVLVSGANKITIEATDNGDSTHLVNVPIADSAAWIAGKYVWRSYITKDITERYSIGTGNTEVIADFESVVNLDARSDWQVILDNLMAAYKKLTTTSATVVTISVAGRSTTFRSAAELLTQINNAQQQVKREKDAQALRDGMPLGNKIHFRL